MLRLTPAVRTGLLPTLYCLLTTLSLTHTHAATNFWDGGGTTGNWTNAANWSNNVAPVFGADLVFPAGASRLENTNNFAGSAEFFHSLTFLGAGYTIHGNSIHLTNGLAATHGTVLGSTVFNPSINLVANQTFAVTSTRGSLFLNGLVNLGGKELTFDGAGLTTVNGALSGLG